MSYTYHSHTTLAFFSHICMISDYLCTGNELVAVQVSLFLIHRVFLTPTTSALVTTASIPSSAVTDSATQVSVLMISKGKEVYKLEGKCLCGYAILIVVWEVSFLSEFIQNMFHVQSSRTPNTGNK